EAARVVLPPRADARRREGGRLVALVGVHARRVEVRELAGHRELAREPVAKERRAPARRRAGARGEEGLPPRLVPERRVEVERRARRAHVTFMAKYDMGAAGSSLHLPSSLWDKTGRKARFATRAGAAARGGSPLFGHWLAGQLAMARELAYFYAPGVNSYKRYQAASFAPTRIVAGWDNRTCGFRLCGERQGLRVENRIPGADANPYLAF